MNQPTPVTVKHVCGTCGQPGRTTYVVRGLEFTRPKDACRAADAFDRGITLVSPLRSEPDSPGPLGADLRAETGSERSDDTTLLAGAGSLPTVPAHPAASRLTPLASGQRGADAPG